MAKTLKPLRDVEHAYAVLRDHELTPHEISGAMKQQIYDWKTRGHFPPQTYLLYKPVFEKLGYEATPALWQMRTEPYQQD